MGSGFKDFAAGDVLTAADVDGYLMRQTVMTFADASARDTALSGVLDEGMMAFLEDTDRLTYYTGSAWVDVSNASSAGVYQDYVPTFSNISFSTYVARYALVNKMLHVWFYGVLDATVADVIQISAPVATYPSNTTSTMSGVCYAVDANTAATYYGVVFTRSDDVFRFVSTTDGGSLNNNYWDNAAPFTWASGDVLTFSMTVEAT